MIHVTLAALGTGAKEVSRKILVGSASKAEVHGTHGTDDMITTTEFFDRGTTVRTGFCTLNRVACVRLIPNGGFSIQLFFQNLPVTLIKLHINQTVSVTAWAAKDRLDFSIFHETLTVDVGTWERDPVRLDCQARVRVKTGTAEFMGTRVKKERPAFYVNVLFVANRTGHGSKIGFEEEWNDCEGNERTSGCVKKEMRQKDR